jgi:anti-sigma factor RsiW
MMEEHDEFALLDGYALGTLAPAEREHVREHLASCASCRREYDEIRNIFDVLPHESPERAPTAASRDRLLARIDAFESAAPKVVPLRVPWAGLLAAGFVLALAADGWFAWQLHDASAAPASALVAALSTGHVYGVDGVVGSEPWHLTIVQPPNGANAVIYSQVPNAPSGDTYRTWVVRDGQTFDAGELPAATQAKLEMPMPLKDGDVVAFSREPIGTGDRPTTPFLMQITIKS